MKEEGDFRTLHIEERETGEHCIMKKGRREYCILKTRETGEYCILKKERLGNIAY